jgi:DNA-directed RNA polymerase specialized sigma24 family protein
VDRELLDILFTRYRLPVFRFLRRVLHDPAAAEDLTQDVFLRALGARYRADDCERAWVFRQIDGLANAHRCR